MHEIKKHHLIEAMKAGRNIDGPAFFDAKRVRWPFGKAPWLKPFQPPFQQASFEHGVPIAATSPVAATDAEPSGLQSDETATKGAAADPAKPIPRSGLSITDFEKAADDARAIAGHKSNAAENWPFVRRNTLREALAEAALTIANPVGTAKEISRMRSGLQLFRVKICGDHDNVLAPLTLANGDLPFSLRFIACVFEIPLALSNLNLVTLDLSGSALTGVDATFLRARGSVRMRRCYSDAPVDFAGAQIHGYFDGCDMLLQPFGKLPAGQAINGDRGMLNLNQASIDNEVRLIRAMIWGGLSMRGLKTLRSVWLDEAILLSPLAVLEKMFVKALHPVKPLSTLEERYNLQLPRPKRTEDYESGLDKRRGVLDDITFDGCLAEDNKGNYRLDNCLDVLMRENLRVRTSGLRGDGVMIAGSLFARDIMCRGRLRLKYAKVDGALWLQGSKLSSAEALRATFDDMDDIVNNNNEPENTELQDAIKISRYRSNTYEKFSKKKSSGSDSNDETDDNLAFGADEYALDLREAQFGGSVNISSRVNEINGSAAQPTNIDGVINISRARIEGKLTFDQMDFEWRTRWKFRGKEGKEKTAEHWRNERDYEVFIGNQYALVAQGIVVGDDVSFYNCENLNGANFGSSRIGGSVSFFGKMERSDGERLKLTGAATGIKGRVSLEGAIISGDCKLVFNKNKGPVLKLERVEVSGMLAIAESPADECKNAAYHIDNSSKLYSNVIIKTREREKGYLESAVKNIEDWDKFDFPVRKVGQSLEKYLNGCANSGDIPNPPMIDLANAKVGYLHHPPAAWPQMGRLKVMGFHYQRALRYGPLAPHPFAKGNVGRSRLEVAGSSLVTLGLFGVSIGGICYCWNHAWGVGPWEAWALAVCFTVSWIYRCLNVGIFGLRRTATNSPMAIAWLRLQTVERNAYKLPRWFGRWRGHIYHSLEPYAVAAAALREEGRWVSANLVEEESLKVREKQLSWRLSLGQKLLDRSVALVNCYGFSLERPAFLTTVLLLFGAVLAHDAASNCAITPKADATIGCQPFCAWEVLQESNCDTMSSGFRPSLYAIEKVLPGVDLNQENYWTLSKNATPFNDKSLWTYEVIFSLLHILGLGVFGLLAVAVTTRLGLTFKRYNG